MKTNTNNPTTALGKWGRFVGAMLILALMMSTVAVSQTHGNPAAVNLGTAGNFRVLAGTAVTIGTGCIISGNVGISPGSSLTNNGGTINGSTFLGGTATADTAKSHLVLAYVDVAGRASDSTLASADLGGASLTRGVYVSGAATLAITGTLTLYGTATDIFIFQAASTLTTYATSHVTLVGVLPSNVFWQVGSSATIDGDFKGVILALTAITQNVGVESIIDGRVLARNSFVTVNGASVLPVELVTFIATANRMPAGSGFKADLHWSTATELDNYGFEIERRQTEQWGKIGFVPGAGTSNSPRDYSYTDNTLSPGRYVYRLKQIDINGMYVYHGSVEVEIGLAPQENALMQNYPNPFNPSTNIQYSLVKAGQVSLKIYNVLGNEVATLANGLQEAGSYTVPFSVKSESTSGGNTSTFASGVYFYRFVSGTFVSTKKLILMK